MFGVLTTLLRAFWKIDIGQRLFVGILGGIASGLLIRWIWRLSGKDPGYARIDKTSVGQDIQTPEYYAKAWRDRRLRMVVFKTVQISFFPMLLLLWYLSSVHPDWQKLILAFPVWFLGYIGAGVWLNRFRCPRCGKLFYWRAQLKGYMQRQTKWRDCRYCGLQQDQYPGG